MFHFISGTLLRSREVAPTITEEHAPLFALQQDTATVAVTEAAEDCTSPGYNSTIVLSVTHETHIHILPEHPATTGKEQIS